MDRHYSCIKVCRMLTLYRILLNKRPQWIPTAYWRSIASARKTIAISVVFVLTTEFSLLFGLIVMPGRVLGLPLFAKLLNLLLVLTVLWGSQFLLSWNKRRFARWIAGNDFAICPSCAYRLRGLPGARQCPECGEPIDLGTIRKLWLEWIALDGGARKQLGASRKFI